MVHYQTVGNAWRNCEPSTVSWQHGTTGSGEIYKTGWLKPQPCCSWVVVMWLLQCCFMAAAVSQEISRTKAVELRCIQATYPEPHCSDTQVEDSRQLSQFSWKGVFFWTERWNFTAKCQRIFGVWPLESSFSLWRMSVQHGWEERFWKVKLGGVQDMEHVFFLFFWSKLRADWTQFFVRALKIWRLWSWICAYLCHACWF